MNFASDNWAGASEPIISALAEAARKGGPAYGGDALTKKVEARFAEVFEHDVAVFLVGSGTVANALGLSAYARPGGIIFCHRDAHILVDEAGASEFFGGGVKVVGIDGIGGKLTPDALRDAMARFPEGAVHHGQPVAVSLTQATGSGRRIQPPRSQPRRGRRAVAPPAHGRRPVRGRDRGLGVRPPTSPGRSA